MRTAVIALACSAMPAGAVDLVESYLAAQKHDPIVASAEASHTGGIEVLRQAQAQLGPGIKATGSAGYLQTHLLGFAPSTGTTLQGALSLDQPVFHHADAIAVDQAQSTVLRLDSILAGAQEDLILRVAQAYFNVLLAQDLLEATLREESSIGEQLARAKRSYEVGTVPITDVTDAQARYDVSAAGESQNRSDLELAKRAYEIITGLVPEPLAGVSVAATLRPPQPNNLQYWIAEAQSHSPAVVQAMATYDVQQREIDHSRAARYPTVDLVASLSKETFSHKDLNVQGTGGKTAEIGVLVSLTVWDGGMINSHVRQALAGADQAHDDLQSSRDAAVQAARQYYLGTNSAVDQVRALEKAAVSGRVSLEGSLRGQEVGTRTAIDVLNARTALFQTLRQLAAERYTVLLDTLQLKAATGNLTAHDLESLTSLSAPAGLFAAEPPMPH